MKMRGGLKGLCFLALGVIFVSGCGGLSLGGKQREAYVLLSGSILRKIKLSNGNFVDSPVELEVEIESIALDPDTERLYGFGADARLYRINPSTGDCTAISAAATALNPDTAGMTVDPFGQNIRYFDSGDGNFLLRISDGVVVSTDDDFGYKSGDPNQSQNPNIHGGAFDPDNTDFYAIDSANDVLARSTDVDSGDLETVGELGYNFAGNVGFYIDKHSGNGYAVCDAGDRGFYRIDTETGDADVIRDDISIKDIAIRP